MKCELCGGPISPNFRCRKLGDRYQHMEEPCLKPFTDWPNVETDMDAWKEWAKHG